MDRQQVPSHASRIATQWIATVDYVDNGQAFAPLALYDSSALRDRPAPL
jgi:hypothetical protein